MVICNIPLSLGRNTELWSRIPSSRLELPAGASPVQTEEAMWKVKCRDYATANKSRMSAGKSLENRIAKKLESKTSLPVCLLPKPLAPVWSWAHHLLSHCRRWGVLVVPASQRRSEGEMEPSILSSQSVLAACWGWQKQKMVSPSFAKTI